jgi:hypothetical protein
MPRAFQAVMGLWALSLAGCSGMALTYDSSFPAASQTTVRAADEETGFASAASAQAASSTAQPIDQSAAADHIYIFLINGLDPLHYADLPGLADHLCASGYSHVYYRELLTAGEFVEQIKQIAQEDARAKFVLIGYSFGANQARNITHALRDEGIAIDLLVYLNANTLRNTPYDRPDNARRVLNILAWGFLLDGAQLDNAENIEIADAWHFNTPTHPQTIQIIKRELSALQAPCLPSPSD